MSESKFTISLNTKGDYSCTLRTDDAKEVLAYIEGEGTTLLTALETLKKNHIKTIQQVRPETLVDVPKTAEKHTAQGIVPACSHPADQREPYTYIEPKDVVNKTTGQAFIKKGDVASGIRCLACGKKFKKFNRKDGTGCYHRAIDKEYLK